MDIQEYNWYKNPKKYHLLIVTMIFLLCNIQIVSSKTDSFTKNFFNSEYYVTHLLIIFHVILLAGLYRNYFAAKKNRHNHSPLTKNDL